MDWNFAQANWTQFRDEVHANWTMLTSGQLLEYAEGVTRHVSQLWFW